MIEPWIRGLGGGLMRCLSEIINAVKHDELTREEELRYAIRALHLLATHDTMDLEELASAEKEGTRVFLTAGMRYTESFSRWKRALATDPKSWLAANGIVEVEEN